MPISARNIFRGQVAAIRQGPVHAEVELITANGERIIATITHASVDALGLAVGKAVAALVKAPSIVLLTGAPEFRFSARNQLSGTVTKLARGAVNTQVTLQLSGGSPLHAVVTNDAADELGLACGGAATAMFKASQVVLGVPL